MATITKKPLSASTNGKQVPISATSSAAPTTVHTAVSGTSSWDEIWVYASNCGSASLSCSIQWGANNTTDVVNTIINPYSGRVLICDGKLLQNGLVVGAWTAPAVTSGSLNIDGFVNQIV